jgi:hypothetical protein
MQVASPQSALFLTILSKIASFSCSALICGITSCQIYNNTDATALQAAKALGKYLDGLKIWAERMIIHKAARFPGC